MNGVARAPKDRSKTEPASSPAAVARAPVQPKAAPAPGWSTGYAGPPFALGDVQRKVAIGQVNDPYEQEAERVSQTIASGGSVWPRRQRRRKNRRSSGLRHPSPARKRKTLGKGRPFRRPRRRPLVIRERKATRPNLSRRR